MSPSSAQGLAWPSDTAIDGRGYRNLDGLMLREYGPIQLQTAREKHMIERIQQETHDPQTALVIAGLAHHHSLSEKLTSLGYEVEAFCFIRPGDPIPEFVSPDWKWRPAASWRVLAIEAFALGIPNSPAPLLEADS
jgi:hypothetical protein